MAQRKISYYTITLTKNDYDMSVNEVLTTILSYIDSMANEQRKQDIGDDRFCFLFSQLHYTQTGISHVIFKSAKHSYRAPLINRETLEERENPKLMDEGELHRTHMAIKHGDDESIVLLETAQNMLSIKTIINYLNLYLRIYDENNNACPIGAQLAYNLIPNDDFDHALRGMTRVKAASVVFHKQIIGSEALGFSQQMDDLQDDVEVILKAKRNRSIYEQVVSALNFMNSGQSVIQKIRVKGMTDDIESVIDTSVIVKKTYVEASRDNDTGEYNGSDILSAMDIILRGM